YEFVRNTNGYKDESPEQVDAVKVRSQDALQDVEKARDIVQTVVREMRRIHRECQINRVNDPATNRAGKMANWIDRILGENVTPVNDEEVKQVAIGLFVPKTTFPQSQNLLNNIQNQLNAGKWAPLAAVSDAEINLNTLERDLADIRRAFGEEEKKENLIRQMRAIIQKRELVRNEIARLHREWEEETRDPTPALGAVGAQLLVKGETKKIRQTIRC